jgi:hypothetical protein
MSRLGSWQDAYKLHGCVPESARVIVVIIAAFAVIPITVAGDQAHLLRHSKARLPSHFVFCIVRSRFR